VYRLPVISIRMFNVYGPRVRTTGAYGAVFGVFLAQKLHGKPFTVVGDGSQRRDFVFVTDVARAYLMAAESSETNQVFNLGAGDPQTINRLIELMGGDVVHLPKRPGEPDCTWANIGRIQRALGWKPEVSFPQGVAAMLGQIEEWRAAPLWTPEKIEAATRTWFEHLAR
jgi:UDP-glucose 4-epimerase